MLKVKNIFMLALLTVAVGLFVPACDETPVDPDPEGYSITLTGGTMTLKEDGSPIPSGEKVIYEGDEVVIVLTATPGPDEVFAGWEVTPSIYAGRFTDATAETTEFRMPAADVTIKAVFEDDVLPEGYTISIVNGKMWLWTADGDPYDNPLDDGDIAFERDTIIVISAVAPEGQVFKQWNVVPATAVDNFRDRYDTLTTFRMPASDVTITAVFDFPPVDGTAQVRFTWEASEEANIEHISVDSGDVAWWYAAVYMDTTNVDEDFTDIPLYGGNPSVESIAAPYDATNENKGRYFETEAGSFTAVCGVKDPLGLAEIVANYTITIDPATTKPFTDGKDLYFEIAFDVGTFLSEPGMDSLAWFQEETDDPDQAPRLEKKKAPKFGVTRVATKQYKKPGGTLDVTYYVIRRPKV
jgi:hypothetical protein